MVVYVEYVFLDNFFIDALLLLAARRTLKLNTKLLWLAIPALIGAGAALAVPLVSMIKGVLFCTRVLLGFILVALSGKFKNFKEYIFCYYLFIFYTFSFGGCVAAICFLTGIKYDILTTFGEAKLPVGFCAFCCLVLYISISRIVKKIYDKKIGFKFSAECSLTFGEESFLFHGFIDSGNRLVYSPTASPIVICSPSAYKKAFFGIDLTHYALGETEIRTVAGKTKIKIYKPDRIVIYTGTRPSIINNVVMGVADMAFETAGDFDLLLSPILV